MHCKLRATGPTFDAPETPATVRLLGHVLFLGTCFGVQNAVRLRVLPLVSLKPQQHQDYWSLALPGTCLVTLTNSWLVGHFLWHTLCLPASQTWRQRNSKH